MSWTVLFDTVIAVYKNCATID